jgi:hypothetical protein
MAIGAQLPDAVATLFQGSGFWVFDLAIGAQLPDAVVAAVCDIDSSRVVDAQRPEEAMLRV